MCCISGRTKFTELKVASVVLGRSSVRLFDQAEGHFPSVGSLSCPGLAFEMQAAEEQASNRASCRHRIRVVLPSRELLLPLKGTMFSGTGVDEAMCPDVQSLIPEQGL